jgi:uncharacterized Rmd1/YagE family protein
MQDWLKFEVDDSITLKKTNFTNLYLISLVLSKSISLKKREKQIDYIMDRFKEVNEKILSTSSVNADNEKKLVQIICKKNIF